MLFGSIFIIHFTYLAATKVKSPVGFRDNCSLMELMFV